MIYEGCRFQIHTKSFISCLLEENEWQVHAINVVNFCKYIPMPPPLDDPMFRTIYLPMKVKLIVLSLSLKV